MPQFSYKAIGRDGKSFNGVVEADGMELASRQLRGQGFTLLKLEPPLLLVSSRHDSCSSRLKPRRRAT